MAVLAAICVAIWCTIYDRWSPENWNVPIEYGLNPAAADVKAELAGFRMAEDGKLFPGVFHYEPRLNAPYIANWNDYPSNEDLLSWGPGLLARVIGFYPAVNFLLLAVQVLAVLAFYYTARRLKCDWKWSAGAALLYGLAPFAFAHSLHHVDIACYWHIPLGLLVCFWIANGNGLQFRTRDYWLAIGIAVITGFQNVYYTNIFIQLVGVSLIIQWMRHGWREWRVCLPPLSIGTAAFSIFFLLAARVPLYALLHGHGASATVRTYAQMEYYGLKLLDMFMPFPTHKFAPFANFGAKYETMTILPAEVPPACYLGLVGIAAFLWLVVYTVRNAISRPAGKIPLEAVQVLWIIFYGTVGGANAFIGVFGFQLFRSTTRFCIVIMAIALLFAIRRLTLIAKRWPDPWPVLAPVAIAIFGLFEFLPPTAGEDIRYVAAAVNSDRLFAQSMEATLPKGGMVFQLPVMDFPESPAPGLSAYDHFRPYLYSKDLRFSFGTDKGRPENAWQRVVAGMPAAQQIAALERYGFSGIYVNRDAYPDRAEGLLNQYKAAGATDIIESPAKDLVCVVLHPSPNPELPPPAPFFATGWYAEQDNPDGQRVNIANGNSTLMLTNPTGQPETKYANFYVGSLATRTLTIEGDGAYQSWRIVREPVKVTNLRLTLPPGQSTVSFTTDAPGTPQQLGLVTFYIVNFDLGDSPKPGQ
jgi:phosphoglycerol transferase